MFNVTVFPVVPPSRDEMDTFRPKTFVCCSEQILSVVDKHVTPDEYVIITRVESYSE